MKNPKIKILENRFMNGFNPELHVLKRSREPQRKLGTVNWHQIDKSLHRKG